MGPTAWRQAVYRARQFFQAVFACAVPPAAAAQAEARTWLPAAAWKLFDRMPGSDRRHSLDVLRTLQAAGHREPALMQAALLHDAAKGTGGVTVWHRVAVVLLNAVRPGWPARLVGASAPGRRDLRYPFWVHANHPRLGAEMAAEAGCEPLAVELIRRHQEPDDLATGGLLTVLQAADADN